jgi:protein subunit release factor B
MGAQHTGERILSLTKNDFIVRTFRPSGNGGQKMQKTSSGVEIVHPASGATARCTETRSQLQNRQIALHKLTETPEFKYWLHAVTRNLKTPLEIEAEVARELADPEVTITEVKKSKNEWVRVDPGELKG